MTARVRVLHVIQNLNYGGMERLFADIVRLLDPDRFESHVLALGYLGRFGEGLERYATIHTPAPMSRWSMLVPKALTEQIRQIAPDVLHTHSGVWYKTTLAGKRAGVRRLIHTEHGRQMPDPWIHRQIGRLASRRTTCLVAVSEVLQQHLEREVVAPGTRVLVVRNGVDTELYHPQPDSGRIRRELGIPPSATIIGSIGRLELIKGYDVMLEALELFRSEWKNGEPPVLVVGGDGAQRGVLEERIRARGLAGAVHLLGWRDDIHDLHSCFSFFTISSRSEGTSVSLLEAMSTGLCPVVTDVGGNRAVLGPGLAHRLVPSSDPRALAEAWKLALSDPGSLGVDGALARAQVEREFSLSKMVSEYARLYTLPDRDLVG